MRLPFEYRGYTIGEPDNSGGKAGRGKNVTSTIQVRLRLGSGFMLKRQIRYVVGDPGAKQRAIDRARLWIDSL